MQQSASATTRESRGDLLPGVHLRDDDLEPQSGLRFASTVFRICAVVILLLAIWQFADWWMDRPPGNVGLAVLVGESIRLVVVAALLWAASNLAALFVKSHYDLRATRILATRQEYVLRQVALAQGAIDSGRAGARRDEDTGAPGGHEPPRDG
jgi:hypothetical protein